VQSLTLYSFAAALCFAVVGGGAASVISRLRPRLFGTVGLIACGMAGIGVTALAVLFATFVDATAGRVVAGGALIASLVCAVWSGAAHHWRSGLPLVLVTAGVLAATLGLFGLWEIERDPFELAMTRTVGWTLPVDGVIPSLLASWFADSGVRSEFLIDDWLASDRPPLQSGMLLMVRPLVDVASAWGGAPAEGQVDFGASVAAQLLWVTGVLALVASLGFTLRVALLSVVFVAALPTTYINSVFTWPKLLAGAFMVAAIAMLVAALRGRERPPSALVLAAAMSIIGLLCHGGGVFVLPVILALAMVVLGRSGLRAGVRSAAVASGLVAVLYLPWLLFQRLVAPPGDRLLKWHLAGVVQIDERSIWVALLDQYAKSAPGAVLEARVVNLVTAFRPDVFAGWDIWVPGWADRAQHAQFFNTSAALGLGSILVLGVYVVAVLNRGRWRSDQILRDALALIAGMAGCMFLWVAILYTPHAATVHQGSHAWMLVLGALPFALVTRWRWRAAVAVLAAQVVLTAVVYVGTTHYPDAVLRPSAIVFALAGVVTAVAGVLLAPEARVRQAGVGSDRPTVCTRSSGIRSRAPGR
jgi:hypothetical protein